MASELGIDSICRSIVARLARSPSLTTFACMTRSSASRSTAILGTSRATIRAGSSRSAYCSRRRCCSGSNSAASRRRTVAERSFVVAEQTIGSNRIRAGRPGDVTTALPSSIPWDTDAWRQKCSSSPNNRSDSRWVSESGFGFLPLGAIALIFDRASRARKHRHQSRASPVPVFGVCGRVLRRKPRKAFGEGTQTPQTPQTFSGGEERDGANRPSEHAPTAPETAGGFAVSVVSAVSAAARKRPRKRLVRRP